MDVSCLAKSSPTIRFWRSPVPNEVRDEDARSARRAERHLVAAEWALSIALKRQAQAHRRAEIYRTRDEEDKKRFVHDAWAANSPERLNIRGEERFKKLMEQVKKEREEFEA